MPSYAFVTLDVFSDCRFGGNQLAVLTDARGLDSDAMLAITREFNYSESTFVLPASTPEGTRHVRIFTPGGEVPFAGHPTVGTAIALVALRLVPLGANGETRLVLEEGVGPVSVKVRVADGQAPFGELTVAKLPEFFGDAPDIGTLAEVLSLEPSDFVGGDWMPQAVSCGLPFLFVPVRTRDAVARARVRLEPWERALKGSVASEFMVFAMDAEAKDADIRARVFVPGLNVPEDPATGSACAALGGYLARRTPRDNGTLRWVVEQGVEMGRPSRLEIEVDKSAGEIRSVRVGGNAVMVSEGRIEV
jgi:trans-2,3-dihydro-3-hydroxyanthranilate isomerase